MAAITNCRVTFVRILPLFFVNIMEDAVDRNADVVINVSDFCSKRMALVVSFACIASAKVPKDA